MDDKMTSTINNLPVEEFFEKGHRGCAGCGQAIAARIAAKAGGKNAIIVNSTGCMEVFSTPYPETAWKVPWIHGAFENAAPIASGIDKALVKLKKRDKVNLLVFCGDGATFDIGFGALSGAVERGDRFCFVCFDNEAYMNTGIQRSGATPKFASTTTSPVGKKIHGKMHFKKPLPLILAAHGKHVYVANANIAFPHDFYQKVKKGLSHKGPSYIQVYVPCPTGWNFPPNLTIEVAKAALNAKVTPLYEIENGVLKFTQKPSKEIPVKEYFKLQRRFKHMKENEIEEVQKHINEQWEKLIEMEEGGLRKGL